jgi:hypothetical protein
METTIHIVWVVVLMGRIAGQWLGGADATLPQKWTSATAYSSASRCALHMNFLIGAHSHGCDSAHADSPTRSQGIKHNGVIVKYGSCAANKGSMHSCLVSDRRLRQVGLNLN